jgi:2-phosphosulfolactate phosphatase
LKVDAALTNRFDQDDLDVEVKGSVAAVIDVIRATSSIAALFARGAAGVTVASTLEKAYELKEEDPEKLLCGEVNGLAPEGFDRGNSPLEFSRLDLEGREAILKTTNGTASFLRAAGSPAVYSLSALNFTAALEKILQEAENLEKDILFICSGELGRLAYDDAYIAGMAVKYIMENSPGPLGLSDSARLLLSAVKGDRDIESALESSTSARSLKAAGLGDDIPFCARLDEFKVVVRAVTRDNTTRLLPG